MSCQCIDLQTPRFGGTTTTPKCSSQRRIQPAKHHFQSIYGQSHLYFRVSLGIPGISNATSKSSPTSDHSDPWKAEAAFQLPALSWVTRVARWKWDSPKLLTTSPHAPWGRCPWPGIPKWWLLAKPHICWVPSTDLSGCDERSVTWVLHQCEPLMLI